MPTFLRGNSQHADRGIQLAGPGTTREGGESFSRRGEEIALGHALRRTNSVRCVSCMVFGEAHRLMEFVSLF
jgi:hypothetical protein